MINTKSLWKPAMIEKHIRNLLDIVEEKSTETTRQLNESTEQVVAEDIASTRREVNLKKKVDKGIATPEQKKEYQELKAKNMGQKPKKDQGVQEGLGKAIKRGLQGWGGVEDDPKTLVKRNKAHDIETAKMLRKGLDDAPEHSPAGLQKRVLDRKLKGVAEGTRYQKKKGSGRLTGPSTPSISNDELVSMMTSASEKIRSEIEQSRKAKEADKIGKKGVAEDTKQGETKDKPPRVTNTCKVCGRKWQLMHVCKGAPQKKQGVAEAAKWRSDDLEDKTWRNADWDDGDMSSGKIAIDRSGKDVDDSGDELRGRPGSWRGAADMAKRMTKKGVPTKAELGFQNILKHRIKHQKRMGGITGPKGQLPEGQDVAESKSLIKQGISKALMEGYWEDIGKAVMNYKGKELPLSSKKLDVTTDSPHYKLHPEEFKKDVYDQLKDKGLPVAKRPAPSRKVGGLSITPELLHQVWYKLENVVSNVVPDGDPIDWMAPYIRKMGVDPFHTREILDMAVRKHYDRKADYSSYLKDMWDAYGEMQGDDYQNPWK
jgi:DNA-directed RNA polymerase subunit M/transcription elongation factor TFIIS